MTAEQLEELLGKVTQGEWELQGYTMQDMEEFHIYADKVVDGYTPIIAEGIGAGDYMKESGEAYYNATLIALAPSLAHRVIDLEKRLSAAEKLAEAVEKVANMDDATRAFDAAMEVLCERVTAHREASK